MNGIEQESSKLIKISRKYRKFEKRLNFVIKKMRFQFFHSKTVGPVRKCYLDIMCVF